MSGGSITVLITLLAAANSFKILGVFPYAGKSHLDIFLPLMKGLAAKGHEVTVISHFPQDPPLKNYRDVSLKDSAEPILGVADLKNFDGSKLSNWMTIFNLNKMGETACSLAIKSQNLKSFNAEKGNEFDVVITEFFSNDCFLGFVHKFQAALIGISSCPILHYHNERFGNPSHPAYIPNTILDHSDRISLFGRLENAILGLVHQLVSKYVMLPRDQKVAEEFFGEIPPLEEIFMKSSLFFVNAHFSLNLPKPQVPAIVDIAGIHINKGKLPAELEKWINESTDGVIYFSLGSMVKGNSFPLELRGEFLKAFGRLPQRVLWKYENETMPGKPDNVRVQNWLPQLDVLCHPNVKAFISHGGLLGTIEAVNCGVPIIVMPLYGDQHTNAKAIEANKGGVILKFHQATEEKVYQALKTVLEPSFRDGARALSERFRDRPLPPLETAIYWVEYVARHRGAHHMRTAAVDMPFYQYFLLDVFLILILASVISWKVLLLTYRFVRGRKSATQKQKKT